MIEIQSVFYPRAMQCYGCTDCVYVCVCCAVTTPAPTPAATDSLGNTVVSHCSLLPFDHSLILPFGAFCCPYDLPSIYSWLSLLVNVSFVCSLLRHQHSVWFLILFLMCQA